MASALRAYAISGGQVLVPALVLTFSSIFPVVANLVCKLQIRLHSTLYSLTLQYTATTLVRITLPGNEGCECYTTMSDRAMEMYVFLFEAG